MNLPKIIKDKLPSYYGNIQSTSHSTSQSESDTNSDTESQSTIRTSETPSESLSATEVTKENIECLKYEKIHPLFDQTKQLYDEKEMLTNVSDLVRIVLDKLIQKPVQTKTQTGGVAQAEITWVPEKDVELKKEITDFVTNHMFENPKTYISFIKNFVTLMENTIREYKSKAVEKIRSEYGLDNSFTLDDKIRFIFKGGTVLKMIYKQYMSEQPAVVSKKLYSNYKDYFKKSDLDFQIFISVQLVPNNPELSGKIHSHIHNDLQLLSYVVLNRFRNYFITRLSNTYDFYQLNNLSKVKILKTIIEKMNKANILVNSEENKKNIVDLYGEQSLYFAGLKFEDLQLYDVHTNPRIYNELVLQSTTNIIPDDKIKNNIATNLKDFAVNDFFVAKDSPKLPEIKGSKIDEDIQKEIFHNNIKSEFVISINESIKFTVGNNTVHFAIVRMKYNLFAYAVTLDNKLGMFKMPGELIDVSIGAFDDYVTKEIIPYSEEFLTEYKLSNYSTEYAIDEFKFSSYTINGFIHDLMNILYKSSAFPWDDNKYNRRLYRILLLSIILLFNVNVQFSDDVKDILKAITEFPTNDILGEEFKNKITEIIEQLKNPNFGIIENYGIIDILEQHYQLADKINQMSDLGKKEKNTTEFKEYYQIIITNIKYALELMNEIKNYNLNKHISHVTDKGEEGPRIKELMMMGGVFFRKYMKYKTKSAEYKNMLENGYIKNEFF